MKKIKNIIILVLLIAIIFLIVHLMFKEKPNQKIQASTSKQEVWEKIPYYKKKNQERYIKYQKENTTLSKEQVITQVNIGLDYSFYTHTKKTPFLNQDHILVNKYLYLGSDYIPNNLETISTNYARSGMMLVSTAKEKFEEMAQDAKKENIKIIAMSSYRSYDYQVKLYNNYVKSDGVEAADTYSARAGYSEHQTGLCVDVYDGILDYTNFENSESFNWMQKNAHHYGFILRYPKGKEKITGYQYESWHYRYVGEEIATKIHDQKITFDEYYVKNLEK